MKILVIHLLFVVVATALQVSQQVNRFSNNLYKKIAEVEDGNIIFSPFSLHTALSMAMEGSQNGSSTHQELAKALYGSEDTRSYWMDIAKIHHDYNTMRSKAQVEVANKIFTDQSLPMKQRYRRLLHILYRSSLEKVDFSNSKESADAINAFVAKATHGLIEEITEPSSIDPMTRLMLINAIYFKANWKIRFDGKMTRPMTFKVRKGLEVKCDGMNLPKANLNWASPQGLNGEILELPYDDPNFRMLLILPHDTIENLDWNALDYNQLQSTDVRLKLPKFKLEYEQEMKELLKKLGMVDMFKTHRANFKEISNEPLYVSQVKHKAVIEVNEQGSEAAAVTSVQVSSRCLLCNKPKKLHQMIFDKPFLFVIQDVKHEIPLFVGRITDPNGTYGLIPNFSQKLTEAHHNSRLRSQEFAERVFGQQTLWHSPRSYWNTPK